MIKLTRVIISFYFLLVTPCVTIGQTIEEIAKADFDTLIAPPNDPCLLAETVGNNYTKKSDSLVYYRDLALRLSYACGDENKIAFFRKKMVLAHLEAFTDSIKSEQNKLKKVLSEERDKYTQLEKDANSQKTLYLGLIFALLMSILIILIFSFRKRIKQTKEHRFILKEQNEELKQTLISKEEKEILLKEIHHRVKNNLQIISSLIRLQSDYIDKDNFQEKLNEVENRIRSMALIHEKLYKSKHLSRLRIKDYIQELSINILNTYDHLHRVQFKFDIGTQEFTIDTLIPIGLILNETISNSLKHAFTDQKAPEIRIAVHNNNMGETIMVIEDNGIGSTKTIEQLKEDSLGMELIFSLAEQLDGILRINTQGGFSYTFVFPHIR